MSVNKALQEIEAIENLIGPYEYESHDAKQVLMGLRDLRKALETMDKEKIRQKINEIMSIEAAAAPYRGYGFVEEALEHAGRLLEELRKIVSE
jgi:plasmid replication initiation protein